MFQKLRERESDKFKYRVFVTFLELYNEDLTDLLHPESSNNYQIRDKVKDILNSNKQLFDNKIKKILFENEPIINNDDLFYTKIIIFSLLFNLSQCHFCYVLDDELYVYNINQSH